MAPQVHQFVWQQFFSDPSHWWDYKRNKEGQVIENTWRKPTWGDTLYGTSDSGINGDHLEIEMCNEGGEYSRANDGVHALNLLVQRGCHISNDLLHRLLKTCITNKDLVLGKRIHALSVEVGYDGDPFLATHLICLYASVGKLEEALQVFSRVSSPSAYNWATIIFAYEKNGHPAQAIRLYQEMRGSKAQPDNRTFVAVLKACASARDLVAGKEVHDHVLAGPGDPDIFVKTGLLHMYAKCGSIEEARSVFDELPERDIVTWTAMIAGYAQKGMGQEALTLYTEMQREGFSAPSFITFVCLLQACANAGVGALHEGMELHAQIEAQGLQDDVVVGGSLVNMYAKCGSLGGASRLFDKLASRNIVTWNAMLSGYVQHGMAQEALGLFSSMAHDLRPDSVTFVCLLQACASMGLGGLHDGKKLHARVDELGFQNDVVVGGSLVNMYAKCGSLEDARGVFNRLPHKNMVTWNAMLAGYVQQGMDQEALSLFDCMQTEGVCSPDSVTYVTLMQSCAALGEGALNRGKQLHAQIEEEGLQNDVGVIRSLCNMYVKCGSLLDARNMFDRIPDKNLVTWTVMIAGYAQQGMGEEALILYRSMLEQDLSPPDSVTFVCLLQACATAGVSALHEGKILHAHIEELGLESDVIVAGSLVNMYAKCGNLDEARSLFERLPDKNTLTWNALIAGYVQQEKYEEAWRLYHSMQEGGLWSPDLATYVSLLHSCAREGALALQKGKDLHMQIQKRGLQDNVTLGGSMVNMYAKCGSLMDARTLFDRLPGKNTLTWNAMLGGYSHQGMVHEALILYNSMQEDQIPPDCVTLICLLQACASVASLPLGKQLHAQIEKQGMQADVAVGCALVSMYAKCGSMPDSRHVFDSLPGRSVEAWVALIAGYARHGDGDVVFDLLDRMTLERVQPTQSVFLSVLRVCSHVGLVEKGRKYFQAMQTEYAITPALEHYTCLMDLLGRAGHLDEAFHLAKSMPFQPDHAVWVTLLCACRNWNNVDIAQQVFEHAVRLNGKSATAYVLMSNIYADAQMWEKAKEIDDRRTKCAAWKEPGQSWSSDMGGVVHTFVVGDKAVT